MPLTLVILAAGAGSRFGAPKQIEPLGPNGEVMLEYAIYDAWRAGFTRVVIVINHTMREVFEATVGARARGRLPVEFVIQDLAALPEGFVLPPGRLKPWGTAHAVLAVAASVTGPFAVANADDFYGATAYQALADFLQRPLADPLPVYALVGFPLGDTLSDVGTVNRAHGTVDAGGWLKNIEEIVGIERSGTDGRYRDAEGKWRILSGDELVSMNLWGFTPAVMPQIQQEFLEFLRRSGGDPRAEFPLPDLIRILIRNRLARVRLLSGAGRWFGVTHQGDRHAVSARLRELVERGEYPPNLWA